MMLCQCHPLYHRIKFQCKGQDHQIRETYDLHCLYDRHCQDPDYLSLKSYDICDQDNSTGHYKIDHKIPVIGPLEHAKKNGRQKDVRHQKLSQPENTAFLFFRLRPSFSDHFHPCIEHSHQKCHKHHIYHMGMKISQNKGIAWEFMYGLITVIHRIIPYVTSCIREPVAGCFCHSLYLPDQRQYTTVDDIMYISRDRYCNTCSNSCQ